MTDIYSPENIARSHARAADIRAKVAAGVLEIEWSKYADDIDAGARERAAIAAGATEDRVMIEAAEMADQW